MDEQKKRKGHTLIKILCALFILYMIITKLSRDIAEWLSYNLFYKPLSILLGDFLYAPFILLLISNILPLFLIFFFAIYFYLTSFSKKKNKGLKFAPIIVILVILVLSFFVLKNQLADINLIRQDRFLSEYSNLSKYYKSHKLNKSRIRWSAPYYYRIDINTIRNKDSKIISTINGQTEIRYDYEYLKLNVYQYYQLEKLRQYYEDKNIEAENIHLKIDYLPNTNTVLKYEIYDPM